MRTVGNLCIQFSNILTCPSNFQGDLVYMSPCKGPQTKLLPKNHDLYLTCVCPTKSDSTFKKSGYKQYSQILSQTYSQVFLEVRPSGIKNTQSCLEDWTKLPFTLPLAVFKYKVKVELQQIAEHIPDTGCSLVTQAIQMSL